MESHMLLIMHSLSTRISRTSLLLGFMLVTLPGIRYLLEVLIVKMASMRQYWGLCLASNCLSDFTNFLNSTNLSYNLANLFFSSVFPLASTFPMNAYQSPFHLPYTPTGTLLTQKRHLSTALIANARLVWRNKEGKEETNTFWKPTLIWCSKQPQMLVSFPHLWMRTSGPEKASGYWISYTFN